MKVEVDVLGSLPNKPTVSVDVKQHFNSRPFLITAGLGKLIWIKKRCMTSLITLLDTLSFSTLTETVHNSLPSIA